MSFLLSSAPSFNPSLASSLGDASKGRLLIEFPFPLRFGWYQQQTSTIFRTFEHRKERQGFRHEFILLKLQDGSVCRIERMGDPNARLDAITPRGSVAYDTAQSFQPDEMDQACLGTSDVIAHVTLPYNVDIMDVLKICRAIHEGEKTRKYTLQVYNCWFFSLAIQVCLTRLVAGWESRTLLEDWLTRVHEAAKGLNFNLQDQNPATLTPPYFSRTFQTYEILTSHHACGHSSTAMEAVKRRLLFNLHSRWTDNKNKLIQGISNLLWHSSILSSLDSLIEENVKEAVMNTVQERFLVSPISDPYSSSHHSLEQLKHRFLTILTKHLCSASDKTPESSPPTLGSTKEELMFQIMTRSESTKISESSNHLDFNIPTEERSTQNTTDWLQWTSQCISYLSCFASIIWGVTHLKPQAEPTLCAINTADQQLESIVSELESLDCITHADLERHIEELCALTENGDAIWSERPWTGICQLINQCVPDSVFKVGGAELVCFNPKERSEARSVVDFQTHVLDRIRIHAEEVEKKWLGSATHIRIELENALSQVWNMIREDNTEYPISWQSGPNTYAALFAEMYAGGRWSCGSISALT
ncbi:unnamed protein product [Rhizoctonia solani]|uniref:Uncharacterized protein n=1 Tax=Rhizoctonia solani TaxID=456999 RepID=A0A8H3HHL5_9AGAM|nr:unnamed protein product [Rhizoctonia solani]